MRVRFLALRYWPAIGGVETLIRQMANSLAERHDVRVLAYQVQDDASRPAMQMALPYEFEPFDDGRVRVEPLRLTARARTLLTPLAAHLLPGAGRYAWGRIRVQTARLYASVVSPEMRRQLGDADVFHMWAGGLPGAAGLRAARAAGLPVLLTPFVHPGHWGDDPASVRMYQSVDRVIGLLHTEERMFRAMGVKPERIAVCGVGNPGVPAGSGAALRRRHLIEGPLVLFLGVRRAYKGFDRLLDAAPAIASRHANVTFAFVGPGAALPPSTARVIDAGIVEDDERGAWLEAADVMVLPSDAEIFPGTILEAWSVGTPVIVSDLPPLVELIERSGGGAVTGRSPEVIADVVSSMLADPAGAAELGRSGYQFWLRGHTVEEAAACLERVYAEVSGRPLDAAVPG